MSSARKADGSDGATAEQSQRTRPHHRRGVFMISIAAELASMHPQTLRTYEARGLIRPQRSAKGTRLYSQEDVETLVRIQSMVVELGLNLAGVERVLELERNIAKLSRRVAELERRELAFAEELEMTIDSVRRSFRAEIVPYRPVAGKALVRIVDVNRSRFPMGPRDGRYGNAA